MWFDDPRGTDTSQVGGKFANLVRLHRLGASVPPAFAVTTFAYRKFMVQLDEQVSAILDKVEEGNIDSAERASEQIGGLVEATPIPEEVAESIAGAYSDLAKKAGVEKLPVAVRSSATAEDMLGASVAGQHETFLWITGDEVLAHVRRCWASAFAARSMAYRNARGISQAGVEMGVVVQKMVSASKSGVMFTLNPANGDRSKISIDAAWGLGEAVVSGVVTPDLYVVDKVTMEILAKKVGAKQVEFVVSGGSVVERETPAARRNMLCLADAEVLELARTGKALEKAFGKPQDIEWAIEDSGSSDSLFVLQARPETVWSSRSGPKTSTMDTLDRVVDAYKKSQRTR